MPKTAFKVSQSPHYSRNLFGRNLLHGYGTYWHQLKVAEFDADGITDIPVGGFAGGYIALSPGLRIEKRVIGLAPPAGTPAVITADQAEIMLNILDWTKDEIRVDVHNPTDQSITATVATPPEVNDREALRTQLTVPAGESILLEQ